jgi:hypothetical protein
VKGIIEGGGVRQAVPLIAQTVSFHPSAEATVWGPRPAWDRYTIWCNIGRFYYVGELCRYIELLLITEYVLFRVRQKPNL